MPCIEINFCKGFPKRVVSPSIPERKFKLASTLLSSVLDDDDARGGEGEAHNVRQVVVTSKTDLTKTKNQ